MGFIDTLGVIYAEGTKYLGALMYFEDLRKKLIAINRPLTLIEQKEQVLLDAWCDLWATVRKQRQFQELLAEANDISERQKRFEAKVRRFLPPPKKDK